jgi:serine protease
VGQKKENEFMQISSRSQKPARSAACARWARGALALSAALAAALSACFEGGGASTDVPPADGFELPDAQANVASVCGASEMVHAACGTEAQQQALRPVGRVYVEPQGGAPTMCTGFLISNNSYFLTNDDCVKADTDLATVRVEFNYQYPNCPSGGPITTTHSRVALNSPSFTSPTLGYSLFRLSGSPAATYGYVQFDPDKGSLADSEIYIGHHPGSVGLKMLSAFDDPSGTPCKVRAVNESLDGWPAAAHFGYTCDTLMGSNGAPVFSRVTNKVVGLHNLGGCNNHALYIQDILLEIGPIMLNP